MFNGIATGFKNLDKKLGGGLKNGELTIIAARPGMGKSTFGVNVLLNVTVNENKIGAHFSLEMTKVETFARLLCSLASVRMEDAIYGNLKPKEWKSVINANEKLRAGNIIIDDSTHITSNKLLKKCLEIKKENSGALDLVIVDCLHFIETNRKLSNVDREEEFLIITRELKNAAKQLNVPILALFQMRSRISHPDITKLYGVDKIADVTIIIDRPRAYIDDNADEKYAEVTIVKQNGEEKSDTVIFDFIGNIPTFKERI